MANLVDDRPDFARHRIGLDTGAYKIRVLTALRIAPEGLEIIQAVGNPATHAPTTDL